MRDTRPAASEVVVTEETSIAALIDLWRDAGMEMWFAVDPAFDSMLHARFMGLHLLAAGRGLETWRASPQGCLALLLLLDQIPRNIFRGTAHMFATDGLALSLAKDALKAGHDEDFCPDLRMFFYLPFTHSECMADQLVSLRKRRALGPRIERKAEEHLRIIERFGRFPHRNAVLGRSSTSGELTYLAAGGFVG